MRPYAFDMFDLGPYMDERRSLVEAYLDSRLPREDVRPAVLHSAMRYSVFAGGKRLRPILCMAAAEALGTQASAVLAPAAALEVLHTYTLIHDDLPCMDNDDLRRGRPTCHVAFGEAEALLAGDALLTLAFELLAEAPPPPPAPPLALIRELAEAAGSRGVIAGQVEDMAAERLPPSPDLVEFIHAHKTAALIRASVRLGALAAGAGPESLAALSAYGLAVGTAFQIADDLLNATGTPEQLGKPAGSDAGRGKMTFVSVYGIEHSRQRARALVDQGIAPLADLPGNADPLRGLARHAISRVC